MAAGHPGERAAAELVTRARAELPTMAGLPAREDRQGVPVHPYARPMTDEPANAEPRAVDPLAARLDRPLTELTVDELMALKAEFEARGIRVFNSVSPEQLVLLAGIVIYSKAFLETLAKHNAEGLIEAVRIRFHKNGKGHRVARWPGLAGFLQ